MKTIKRDGSPCAPNNMNSFLLLCCHVWSIKDDDFTVERELKTTNGKAKVTVESCAGILTGMETNK